MAKDKKTEDQIIEAAHKVFQEEGYAGARMQKIADTANINKGLLHYYFKSKDKLFFTIFSTAVEKMLGKISELKKYKQLEAEHNRLKKMYAELSLLHHAFKDAVEKKL